MRFRLLVGLLTIHTSLTLLLLCAYSAMLKALLTMVACTLLVLLYTYPLMQTLTGQAARILGDLPLDGACFLGNPWFLGSARSKPSFRDLLLRQNIEQCRLLVPKSFGYAIFFVNWVSLLELLHLFMGTISVPPKSQAIWFFRKGRSTLRLIVTSSVSMLLLRR